MRIFRFKQPPRRLLTGVSIGEGLVSGKARLITSHEDIRATRESPVVVSETANTAWLPYLQRQGTKALVTDFGGPNSHAATVSHELGIPAVLGTRSATRDLTDGQEITLLAQGGDFGHVYDGRPEYAMQSIDPSAVPSTRTPVCMTLESGLAALRWWRLPCEGIGLASLDLLLQRHVRVHPMALVRYQDMEPGFERDQVNGLTAGYTDRTDYFLDHLAPALAQMAASQHPRPVVVRLSDLDPGQYRNLLGGRRFEPQQGDLRGASRYLSPAYAKAFELELEAARTVRQDMGFNGLQILVPRCGTIDEGERVQQVMQRWFRSQAGVRPRVHLACVLPQNLDQVRRLAELFDGLYVYLDALPDGQGPARASDPASPKNEAGRLERVLERMRDACAGGNCQLTAVAGEATADGGVLETLIRMGVDAVCVAPQAVPQAKRRLADMEG
jgi:pyruvate,water dikinase